MERKERKKGKSVALKGHFVFITNQVLEVARAAEQETANRKGKNRSNKKGHVKTMLGEEVEILSSDKNPVTSIQLNLQHRSVLRASSVSANFHP